MTSWNEADKLAKDLLSRAWTNLGVLLPKSPVDERKLGIIDPEALILSTLLVLPDARFSLDATAWLQVHTDLLNHQKLKSMVALLSAKETTSLREIISDGPWQAYAPLLRLFHFETNPSAKIMSAVKMRHDKLAAVSRFAPQSIMIRNRLLYGTGARADIISILETQKRTRDRNGNGASLANQAGTSTSTVSRILSDLRSCGFINEHNEIVKRQEYKTGFFISSVTPVNITRFLDARQFKNEKLAESALQEIDTRDDNFTQLLFDAATKSTFS